MFEQDLYGNRIGSVIGETSPTTVVFIVDNNRVRPKIGEYVVIDYGEEYSFEERYVLGMIESIISGNPLVPEGIENPYVIEKIRLFEESRRRTYMKGVIRLLSFISTLLSKNPHLETPKTPPPPLSKVYKASSKLLTMIFSRNERGWIRIGVLASHPDVPYSINVNSIMQRHLAILAVTGAGKSNTVALIASKIVNELDGTVLIFDMHSEYVSSELSRKMNVIEPSINPLYLDTSEFIQLLKIPGNAWRQEKLFRDALNNVRSNIFNGTIKPSEFFDQLLHEIEVLGKSYARESRGGDWLRSAYSVLNKVEDFLNKYRHIIRYDLSEDLTLIVRPGYLNVMDLGSVDEDTADVIVSHYVRRLYYERKKHVLGIGDGYPSPILLVFEEAHVLVPKDGGRLSKYWISRIAREGRKFGIGLILVSQRPRIVDENALSQTNNKIILRIVEPSDLRYVQYVSEYLSDELLKILPGLNVGEAVVIGLMTPLPAIVKIDECRGKRGGRDIDAVGEWLKLSRKTYDDIDKTIDLMGY